MANEFIIRKGFIARAESFVQGDLTATRFIGDGSLLTGIPEGALPGNIAYLDKENVFTQNLKISKSNTRLILQSVSTSTAAIDLMEVGDSFGVASNNGTRLLMDGGTNDFVVQMGVGTSVIDALKIARVGGDATFINNISTTGSVAATIHTSVNQATLPNELVRLDQLSNYVNNISWQKQVEGQVDFTTAEPVAPTSGERWINTVTGVSNVTATAVTLDNIYEWSGASWDEQVPVEGWTLWDKGIDSYFTYNNEWINIGGVINHSALSNLKGGDIPLDEFFHLTQTDYNAVVATDFANIAYTNVENEFVVPQEFTNTVANEEMTFGADIGNTITGSGTNWTGTDLQSGFTHTPGSTANLETGQNLNLNLFYRCTVTVENATQGRLEEVNIGGITFRYLSGDQVRVLAGKPNSDNIFIRPNNDWDGTVKVKIEQVTVPLDALLTFNNNSGSVLSEIRIPGGTSMAIGKDAGTYFNPGTNSLAIGLQAGSQVHTSTAFTAIGNYALRYAQNANYVTAVGYNVYGSSKLTAGNLYNVGVGGNIGGPDSIGGSNILIGWSVGLKLTSGNSNIIMGYNTGNEMTTSSQNILIGSGAGRNSTTGGQNIYIGYNAGFYNTTGGGNAVVGRDGIRNNIDGFNTTVLGNYAGRYDSTGAELTTAKTGVYIGYDVRPLNTASENEVIIGYNTIGHGDNTVTIGNLVTTDNYFTGNVRAGYFYGSGEFLTDIPASAISLPSNVALTDALNIFTENQTINNNYRSVLTIDGGTSTQSSTAVIELITSSDFRGRGTWYKNHTDIEEWFLGVPYTGARFHLGFDATGGQAEYDANAVLTIDKVGNAKLGGYFIPLTDNVNDLGSTSYRWEYLHLGKGAYIGNFSIISANNSISIQGSKSISREGASFWLGHDYNTVSLRTDTTVLGDLTLDDGTDSPIGRAFFTTSYNQSKEYVAYFNSYYGATQIHAQNKTDNTDEYVLLDSNGDFRPGSSLEQDLGLSLSQWRRLYVQDVYASGALRINNIDINTAGTLSNIAYLDQDNVFTAQQKFNGGARLIEYQPLQFTATTWGKIINTGNNLILGNNSSDIGIDIDLLTGNTSTTGTASAADPTDDSHLTTKRYVDNNISPIVLSQQDISYGESWAANYRSNILDDGGTWFPNPVGYNVGVQRRSIKPSLEIYPCAVKEGVVYTLSNDRAQDGTFTRNCPATYVDEDGVIKTAANNVARIDYSSGEGVLLLETQATNIAPKSELLESRTGQNMTNSLFGSENGINIFEAEAIGVGFTRIYSNDSFAVIVSSGETANYSMYIKDFGGIPYYYISLNANEFIKYNTITKEVEDIPTSVINLDVKQNLDGWTYFSYSFTATANIQYYNIVYFSSDIGNPYSGVPIGTKVQYKAIQVELNNTGSSYNPTYGSTATRLKDELGGFGSFNDFNSEELTIFLEIKPQKPSGKISINAGNVTNIIDIADNGFATNFECRIFEGGAGKLFLNDFNFDYSIVNKLAYRIKSGDSKSYKNGQQIHSSAATFNLSALGLNRLDFNRYNQLEFRGDVYSIKVYKQALTDEQLQELTTYGYIKN